MSCDSIFILLCDAHIEEQSGVHHTRGKDQIVHKCLRARRARDKLDQIRYRHDTIKILRSGVCRDRDLGGIGSPSLKEYRIATMPQLREPMSKSIIEANEV